MGYETSILEKVDNVGISNPIDLSFAARWCEERWERRVGSFVEKSKPNDLRVI
jgi:hypothetical protein